MALGSAALVAVAIAAAAPVAPAAPTASQADLARLQAQVEALTATPEAPAAQTVATTIRARLRAAEAVLRRVGLDPQRFAAAPAVGGPYVPAATATPPLMASLRDVAALEAAIAAIPSYVPVKTFTYTSPFGYRSDPFNGRAALHAGLDMSGQQGEPIYAAADGTVVTGGRSGAYGNLVEIDHGKGLATRYGHLSAILVHPGEHVHQGELIARMGSTGRSTGTHLHYEIRVDGRAINPRPFLEASAFMLAAQGQQPRGIAGPTLAAMLPDDDSVAFSLNGSFVRN